MEVGRDSARLCCHVARASHLVPQDSITTMFSGFESISTVLIARAKKSHLHLTDCLSPLDRSDRRAVALITGTFRRYSPPPRPLLSPNFLSLSISRRRYDEAATAAAAATTRSTRGSRPPRVRDHPTRSSRRGRAVGDIGRGQGSVRARASARASNDLEMRRGASRHVDTTAAAAAVTSVTTGGGDDAVVSVVAIGRRLGRGWGVFGRSISCCARRRRYDEDATTVAAGEVTVARSIAPPSPPNPTLRRSAVARRAARSWRASRARSTCARARALDRPSGGGGGIAAASSRQ